MSSLPTTEPDTAALRRRGEFWSVAFAGDAFLVRDSKGLRHLAHLLARPWVEIHALELVGLAEGVACRGQPQDALQAGLRSRAEGADQILDAAARAAYRRRAAELRAELARASPARVAALRDELTFVLAELEAGVGRGGRPRLTASPGERARQSVTKAIRNAQARLVPYSPALAGHLDRYVVTGTRCIYTPARSAAMGWRT